MTTAHRETGHTEAHTAPDLSILYGPAYIVVWLRGDIDAATASALRDRLLGILHPGMGPLIIDLSEVPFCDSAGLAVLIGTQRRASLLDIPLRLVAPRARVAKLLRITGLNRILTVHPTLPDALAETV
jgi:anti-anti-sigma factor